MFVPATNVNVSSSLSATTSVCPEIAIVLNEFLFNSPVPDGVPQLNVPLPSVVNTWFIVPSPSCKINDLFVV